MYEQYYGFSELPFAAKPAAGQYYFNEHQQRVLDELESSIDLGNCVCVVSGADGVGKSTLVQSLCERVKDRVVVCNIDVARLSDETPLLQEILSVLGVEAASDTPGTEVQSSLDDQLASQLATLCESGQKGFLVVYNADCLKKPDRQLLDWLVGNPGLQILLTTSQQEPEPGEVLFSEIADNVVSRYTLAPLSTIETDAYIRERLTQVGGSREVFTPSAIETIHRYCDGFPRLINRICDLALEYGFSNQHERIDRRILDLMMNERWDGNFQQDDEVDEEEDIIFAAADSALLDAGRRPTLIDAPPRGTVHSVPMRLVEILGQDRRRDIQASQTLDDDVYDFIRLALQQQQQQVRRIMFGTLSSVILIAVGTVAGFIIWQSSDRASMPVSLAMSPTAESALVAPLDKPEVLTRELKEVPVRELTPREAVPAVEQATLKPPRLTPREAVPAVEQTTLKPRFAPREDAPAVEQAILNPGLTPREAVPAVEQTVLEVPVPPRTVKNAPEPVEGIKQAKLISDIEAKNRALQHEREELAKERKLLEKKLAAQRAETKRLKSKSAAEKKRMEQLVNLERKKNASAAMWEEFNKSGPESYSEDD